MYYKNKHIKKKKIQEEIIQKAKDEWKKKIYQDISQPKLQTQSCFIMCIFFKMKKS